NFRTRLFTKMTVERLDFLVNNRLWMFDTHPQYTVALVVARAMSPSADHRLEVAGVADSATAFASQSIGPGLALSQEALGPHLEVPLLPSQPAADLLGRIRSHGKPFALGAGRWTAFGVQELNATTARPLWLHNTSRSA